VSLWCAVMGGEHSDKQFILTLEGMNELEVLSYIYARLELLEAHEDPNVRWEAKHLKIAITHLLSKLKFKQ